MERTPGAHDGETPSAPSPTPDDCTCVLCGERIGSQPWATLACGAEHVAHNVCLFERALASECCAVRCGRAGCGRTTQVSSATTMYAGVRRFGASRHVAVAAGPVTLARPSGGAGRDGARRGSAAVLEASGPAFAALPFDLIVRVLVHLGSARDLAAANAASRLFRGAPGSGSAVEHALRERVRARGHERALPTLPRTWTAELLERERVLEMSARHACVAACCVAFGDDNFSAFVDAEGGLHTCGEVLVPDQSESESDDEDEEVVPGLFAPLAISHGQLMPPVCVPTRVASLSAVCVVAVAAGRQHLLALSEAGAVYGCGENGAGWLGLGDCRGRGAFARVDTLLGEVIVAISAGGEYSLALTAAGVAYSWGFNGNGQLGHGDTRERPVPTRIEALSGVRVGGVAAGDLHTLLLSTQGAVYSCGHGYFGQLGHGDKQEQHTPRCIEALAGVRAVHVSAGDYHSLVVDTAGGVHSCGEGHAKLGYGDMADQSRPRQIEALAGMRAVRSSASPHCSAVLGADGGVHVFGKNHFGHLGLGPGRLDENVMAPERVHALSHERVVQCSFGGTHALFVSADGAVHSCGMHSAALGQGKPVQPTDDMATPTRVETAWRARVGVC